MLESEIVTKIMDLKKELHDLSKNASYDQPKAKIELDAYNSERIKNEIEKLEQELFEIHQKKLEDTTGTKKTIKTQTVENKRKETFKKVKKSYKTIGNWSRFMNLIQGKTPNWSKVKKYSQEELDFLLTVHKGETISQKESFSRIKEKNSGDKKSFSEIRKNHQQMNNDKFVRLLNSHSRLVNSIEVERLQEIRNIRGR